MNSRQAQPHEPSIIPAQDIPHLLYGTAVIFIITYNPWLRENPSPEIGMSISRLIKRINLTFPGPTGLVAPRLNRAPLEA